MAIGNAHRTNLLVVFFILDWRKEIDFKSGFYKKDLHDKIGEQNESKGVLDCEHGIYMERK